MLSKVEKEQLKVPAHIDYLGDLRDFVTQVGRKHGFPDKVINAFKLAVDEAATNIIRHAYREADGLITIRSIVRKNSLTLCIIDQGAYFDPKRVKDPDLNRYIDIGKKGGPLSSFGQLAAISNRLPPIHRDVGYWCFHIPYRTTGTSRSAGRLNIF